MYSMGHSLAGILRLMKKNPKGTTSYKAHKCHHWFVITMHIFDYKMHIQHSIGIFIDFVPPSLEMTRYTVSF